MRDDAQLIAATLAGDKGAFGQLVVKYQDRLFNMLTHVVGSPDDALDVAQEAFVQAFVKLESFRGSAAFYTWLYRIAFNQAITSRRRARPVASIDQARSNSGAEPLDPGAEPGERLLQQERIGQVRAALASLREEHRAILVLREIDGCCYETIAEILDMPVGTVRSRLHRARLQLREKLQELVGEESRASTARLDQS